VSIVLRKLLADRAATLGLLIIIAATTVAVFEKQLAPYPDDAYATNIVQRLMPPSAAHVFGTDAVGRDVLSRVILGTDLALLAAIQVVLGSVLIGVPLGLIAGYYGRWGGETIMRVTDLFLAVPHLILAIVFVQLMQPSLRTAVIALTITYWPFFARTVYAETRALRRSVFVEALEAIGASGPRIMFLHVLPNTLPPIIVRATIGLGFIILTVAVLGFLGMGEPPPEPEWGKAINESRDHLPDSWWLAVFPGLAIFLLVLGFNLLGDGLRDLVDPKIRRSR
jgi:peptide/nickel transport system permease protein